MAKPELHIVRANAPKQVQPDRQPDTESQLTTLVPEMVAAEAWAADLHRQVDALRRQLANERNVAFIRMERVVEEFGQ